MLGEGAACACVLCAAAHDFEAAILLAEGCRLTVRWSRCWPALLAAVILSCQLFRAASPELQPLTSANPCTYAHVALPFDCSWQHLAHRGQRRRASASLLLAGASQPRRHACVHAAGRAAAAVNGAGLLHPANRLPAAGLLPAASRRQPPQRSTRPCPSPLTPSLLKADGAAASSCAMHARELLPHRGDGWAAQDRA